MSKFFRLIFIAFFWCSTGVQAQIFGGTPPSVHWKQMESLPARIIYPSAMEAEARQVAFIAGRLSETTLSTIGSRQKPIDIVFRNFTTVSNGYVQLAPFRSEFQLTPTQNSFYLGSLPWNQTLAIHEYRHVQQYNNFRVGLSKAFYFLFGQDGLAFANNLSVPNWFWEGDAVYQETLVSQQGRGRLPLFLTGYEALWISGKNYSWMKLRNGSYRDYVPDHYPLGYMMVAYGRDRYGADFWKKTAGEAASFNGLFYPLQHAIKKNAGISYDSFHTRALSYFRNQLSEEDYRSRTAEFGRKSVHFVADELFPQFTDDNRIIYLKSSYREPPEFRLTDSGLAKSRRIAFQSVTVEDAFSYRNGKIAYTAFEPDLRWGWRDYSVIRILDLKTKKDNRLTSRTKYFAPDISPDGTQLVAVRMPSTDEYSLDLIDLHTGKILHSIPNPQQRVYTYPKFLSDSQLVAAVRDQQGQMCVMTIDIPAGKENMLTEWSMDPVGFISVQQNKIYFTRSFQEEDQGFCLQNGQVYRMDSGVVTGQYQLSGRGKKMVWTSFTSAGYRMQTGNRSDLFQGSPEIFPRVDTMEKRLVYSLNKPPFQLPFPIPDNSFAIRPYPALSHPFNFHSWRPYINDPDYTFSLLGQNVLNTLQSEIYVGYNSDEQYKKTGVDFTYGGFFPWINIGAQYRFDRSAYFHGQKILFNEFLPYAGISVPLNLSRGRWLTSLSFGANITYHLPYFKGAYKDSLKNNAYLSLDPQLFFSHQLQAARMQIYPSFAQTFLLRYNKAISNKSGNQLLGSANLFFPGIISTHSLLFNLAYQQHDSLYQTSFSNGFPFAHGYTAVNFFRMYGFGINYNFPLVYPDWGFASVVYFLRLRANAFFNYTGVPYYATNGPGVQSQYRSAGLELYVDTKWWNELPLSFGIRYSRVLDPDYGGRGPNQWEIILPLNILDKGYSNHVMNP